ncbi:hypothetical protein [Labrenzia sp. PHM005]|uniref:hypothetical protein n=1 Tax=Labrenzia sp. PHM005 TaxID=2590016 RepID=UPI00114023D1|nr:hypothetical protein [Labrenzia sp. PHM005]QDG77689.1 hypothetical protein FJ695_18485 [Labrenzia sp. PHM005]
MRLLISVFAILFSISSAFAEMSWRDAISAVEAKSERYFNIADSIDSEYLGTGYNEVNANEHRCSILGRMLKKKKVSAHLDVPAVEEPKTGHDFRVEGQSLENWATAAKYLITLSKPQKVRLWNTDCAGKLGIPASARIKDVYANEFYDIRDGVLHVLGPVTKGYADRLNKAVNENPGIKTVALGSDGGNVLEALKAGINIRARGLETTLWNGCYSACPLVFLGGVSRVMWSPYEDVGFHKVHTDFEPVPLDDSIYSLIFGYIKEMGADPEAVISFMWSAEPKDIFVAKHEQLCAAAVTTWIQRVCSADEYR